MLLAVIIIGGIVLISGMLFYASYAINSGVYLRAFCRGKTTEKVVSLTFDDGPSPEITPRILDILKEHHIEAAFFIAGIHIEGNEALLKRMRNEGHIIGNHSFCHRWNFPLLGASAIVKDIKHTNRMIKAITGEVCAYFRPPFGVTNPHIAKAVKKLKLQTIGWSIRSLDTCAKGDSAKTLKRIMKRLHKGGIILLHDRLPELPETLEMLIRELTQKGYRVVRFDKLDKGCFKRDI